MRHNLQEFSSDEPLSPKEIVELAKTGELRESILTRNLEIFEKRTFPVNHLRTKLRKIWGKVAQSG